VIGTPSIKPGEVLLVEDDPTDVRLVQELLCSAPSSNFNIIAASTLAEGLEHLSSDDIDVILLDLGLPDSQGLDSFRAVKEHVGDVPIIILTVSTDEALGLRAIRAGAQHFFSKDVLTPDGANAEMFSQVIRSAVEHKRVETALRQAQEEVQALNEKLQSTTEELRTANETLEERVQQRTEKLASLVKQLQRHKTMVDLASEAIIVFDMDDRITYWNRGAERLYGWSADKAYGKEIHSFLRTTFSTPLEEIKRTLFEKDVWHGELTNITAHGHQIIVESHQTLQRDDAGHPTAVFEINKNITKRKRAEEQVRAASLYARSLIEASLDPLVTISAEGTITDVNTATEKVTGRSRNELIGSDFSDYFTEPSEARKGYEQVFTEGFVRDYPLVIRHKSGKITDVLYNATVYRNDAGEIQGVFAAARDVTRRKRAEEELRRYSEHLEALVEERTAQLKDAEHLSGIGETAAMIGHDLRNPLQALQYLVDLQKLRFERIPSEKRGAEDWKQEAQLFEKISEQIFYMDKIVGDLQDYARPIAPECEVVAVSTLANDVIASLPPNDYVEIVTDVNDLEVMVDPHLMHRVFANIIVNAMQAMPKGGTLTISASAEDGSVAISVSDTGVGIPDQMRDKLFSPLMTGKAKGSGLGLAVVKRIMDAHGGTITFESDEGKGTTFTMTLPSNTH